MLNQIIVALLIIAGGLLMALHPQQALAQDGLPPPSRPMPLGSPSTAVYNQSAYAWTIIHERARVEAHNRMMRTEFNKWIGHSPARPNINASYMSAGSPLYYMPARGQLVNAGVARSWYW